MKKLKKLLRFIWKFILKLTPKGRENLYYQAAMDNISAANEEKNLVKSKLKSDIDSFLNQKNIRILTVSQKELLVQDKFGKTMKYFGFKLHPESKNLINA